MRVIDKEMFDIIEDDTYVPIEDLSKLKIQRHTWRHQGQTVLNPKEGGDLGFVGHSTKEEKDIMA